MSSLAVIHNLLQESILLADLRTNKEKYRAALLQNRAYMVLFDDSANAGRVHRELEQRHGFLGAKLYIKSGLYPTAEQSLMVDHDKKLVDLYHDDWSDHRQRRRHPSNERKSVTIPGAGAAFQDKHLLSKFLRDLVKIDPPIAEFQLTGSPIEGLVKDYLDTAKVDPVHQTTHQTSGVIRLFHGTSMKRWNTIQKQGLRPGNAPKVYVDLVSGYSEHNIYLACSLLLARNYASRAAVDDRSSAVVLEVTVRDFTKLILDEDNVHWLRHLKYGQKVLDTPGSLQYSDYHFSHSEWKKGPEAKKIMALYMTKFPRESLAYKGAIRPKDLRMVESYKPAHMVKDPDKDQYQQGQADTFATMRKM